MASSLLAVAALSSSQMASAAKPPRPCITETEISSLVIVAMPLLIEGVKKRCGPNLADTGFLATSGDAMLANYAPLHDQAWPAARTGFMKFGHPGNDDPFADLSDSTLEDLISKGITDEAFKGIKPQQCIDLEHVLEAANAVPPQALAGLISAVFGAAVGSRDKDLPICKRTETE